MYLNKNDDIDEDEEEIPSPLVLKFKKNSSVVRNQKEKVIEVKYV